ncbi:MAG: hypothetical protein PHS54_03115, partial [Clostridia bacterium]|nr:hypothetical protein [Clostridia bacterium]
KFIKALYSKTQWFDVLYDKSFGFGKLSNEYDSTFAGKLLQGYAGGLSPENVKCELDKINKAQPFRTNVWIDAEGKLRNDNINTLDLNKAQKFVNEINDWGPSYSIEKEQ